MNGQTYWQTNRQANTTKNLAMLVEVIRKHRLHSGFQVSNLVITTWLQSAYIIMIMSMLNTKSKENSEYHVQTSVL